MILLDLSSYSAFAIIAMHCIGLRLLFGKDRKEDQVNNASSVFIFIINLLIIQGCQSGSVGLGGQLVRLSGWSGWSGWSGDPGGQGCPGDQGGFGGQGVQVVQVVLVIKLVNSYGLLGLNNPII